MTNILAAIAAVLLFCSAVNPQGLPVIPEALGMAGVQPAPPLADVVGTRLQLDGTVSAPVCDHCEAFGDSQTTTFVEGSPPEVEGWEVLPWLNYKQFKVSAAGYPDVSIYVRFSALTNGECKPTDAGDCRQESACTWAIEWYLELDNTSAPGDAEVLITRTNQSSLLATDDIADYFSPYRYNSSNLHEGNLSPSCGGFRHVLTFEVRHIVSTVPVNVQTFEIRGNCSMCDTPAPSGM